MPEERGGSCCRGKGRQVGKHVVDRSDEVSVSYVRHSDDQATREGDGEEEVDHLAKYLVAGPFGFSGCIWADVNELRLAASWVIATLCAYPRKGNDHVRNLSNPWRGS